MSKSPGSIGRKNDDSGQSLESLRKDLRACTSTMKDAPIDTLKKVQKILRNIRLQLGKDLTEIFNELEGMRWEDLDTSQTIASLMDELASSIRTSFQKDSKVGRLRCVADGRDKKPSFRLECLDSHGRQIVRASARDLPKSELVDSPPDKRRKHRKK